MFQVEFPESNKFNLFFVYKLFYFLLFAHVSTVHTPFTKHLIPNHRLHRFCSNIHSEKAVLRIVYLYGHFVGVFVEQSQHDARVGTLKGDKVNVVSFVVLFQTVLNAN